MASSYDVLFNFASSIPYHSIENYIKLKNHAMTQGKGDFFNIFRYMMMIANAANIGSVNIMFVGGCAVFCHLAAKYSEEKCLDWRGTKDIDVVLQDSSTLGLIKGYVDFDYLDNINTTIASNKKKIQLYHPVLGDTTADIYLPSPHNYTTSINDMQIKSNEWNEVKEIELFGIKIKTINLVSLIKMKLFIKTESIDKITNTKLPRTQDIRDIIDLVALAPHEEVVRKKLSDTENMLLDIILSNRFRLLNCK